MSNDSINNVVNFKVGLISIEVKFGDKSPERMPLILNDLDNQEVGLNVKFHIPHSREWCVG